MLQGGCAFNDFSTLDSSPPNRVSAIIYFILNKLVMYIGRGEMWIQPIIPPQNSYTDIIRDKERESYLNTAVCFGI